MSTELTCSVYAAHGDADAVKAGLSHELQNKEPDHEKSVPDAHLSGPPCGIQVTQPALDNGN